jgi:hypothetical protein
MPRHEAAELDYSQIRELKRLILDKLEKLITPPQKKMF